MKEWLVLQNSHVIYMALFFSLLGGAVGLPIPEDLPLLCAGIVIHNGQVNIWITLLTCYTAILLGDCIVFQIGRFFGPTIFRKKLFQDRTKQKRLIKIKRSLEKRSLIMIFVARHLFYLRTITFLSCGALGMSRKRFILTDAAAALISTPLMTYIGYKASEHFDESMAAIRKFEQQGLLVCALIALGYMLYRIFRKKDTVAAS